MSDETIGEIRVTKGEVTADVTPAPNKGGRPKKARGAATTSADAGPAWSIRGVPPNVREMAARASAAHGLTMGDWVSEAIVRYARGDRGDAALEGLNGAKLGTQNLPDQTLPAVIEPPTGELLAIQQKVLALQEEILAGQARNALKPWQRRRR